MGELEVNPLAPDDEDGVVLEVVDVLYLVFDGQRCLWNGRSGWIRTSDKPVMSGRP